MAEATLRPGDGAPDVTLTDATGTRVTFAELWRDKPLLLVFLRHYG